MAKRLINYVKKIFFVSPKIPRVVDIEISTACNLKCKMCKREKFDFGDKFIPLETFKKIIDELPSQVSLISFGGYGEMLMHPQFFDMVKYVKDKGLLTETTSNGTLLYNDEKIMKLLNSGLDNLRISIDHVRNPTEEKDIGHVFSEKLLQNLKRLSILRREKKSKIHLGINTVVHKGNIDEILDIIRFAQDLEFDRVELIRLDTCMNRAERTLHSEKERAIYKNIEKMQKTIEVVTPLNRFAKWRRLYNIRQEFCPFRFESAHIRLNGQVTPCAFGFATHNFGNIHKTRLKDIWQSKKFRDIRNNDKNPVCNSCAIFK